MWRLLYFTLLSSTYFINSAQGLKCFKCDSTKNKNCIDDLTKLNPEDCAPGEDSCVTRFEGKGGIIRECSDKKSITCYEKLCRECNEDACNTHIACYTCDSATNVNCSSNVKISPEICPNGKDKCQTQVKDDKTTERKCVINTTKCDEKNSKTCEICDKTYCNKDVFPKDRQLCFQCNKTNADCNELKTTEAVPCRLYDENEECYTIGTSATEMNRGCKSDNEKQCSGDKCVTCRDNKCNNQVYSRNPSRKCYQCGVNETKCAKDAIVCKKPVEYWKPKEECFTQKTSGGKTIFGCVNDREDGEKPCITENSCKICDEDGCNSGAGLRNTFVSLSVAILAFVLLV